MLVVQGLSAQEIATNLVQWQKPTNAWVEMSLRLWRMSPYAIETNTPAFQEWALNVMLAKANELREKWQLDIPKPLAKDDVYFAAQPTIYGLRGQLFTRDERFWWDFDRNALYCFFDRHFYSQSFRYHEDVSLQLAKVKSQITAKEAERIACEALYALFGMSEKELGYRKRVEVNQYKFQDYDGKVYPLPLFEVTWRMAGPKQYAAENLEYRPVYMQISGITKKVVRYDHSEVLNLASRVPRDPLPINYFQMLGLPDNYLDTLPERKRRFLQLQPLTNSGALATNVIR